MPSTFDVNDVVTVTGTFRNTAGTLANPTTTSLRIKKPDGTVTVVNQASLTNSSAGIWTYDITIDAAGIWRYRFDGTGAVAAAEEDFFYVRRRQVPVS